MREIVSGIINLRTRGLTSTVGEYIFSRTFNIAPVKIGREEKEAWRKTPEEEENGLNAIRMQRDWFSSRAIAGNLKHLPLKDRIAPRE